MKNKSFLFKLNLHNTTTFLSEWTGNERGQAKVAKLERLSSIAMLVNEYVLEFHISVHNIQRVNVRESRGERVDHRYYLFFLEFRPFGNCLEQIASLKVKEKKFLTKNSNFQRLND